jgi:hypothetical protein
MEGTTKSKQRRLGERAWRELVERFDASAVSVERYCRREGLSKSSFQRWRSRLSKPGAHASPGDRRPVEFVDLGSLAQASATLDRLELKLDLGGGLTLQLVRR